MNNGAALQQLLPFTVLKPRIATASEVTISVATALTVYGIETFSEITYKPSPLPPVATALTVYGIETVAHRGRRGEKYESCNSSYRLRY